MTKESLDKLRINLSAGSKNGLNFTLSASIVWIIIACIWKTGSKAYDKSILTFMVGALMLPLAILFSKLFKTTFTDKNNELQPLGLWLNFAQLFYFPFLVFVLIKMPVYFIMVLGIITGAHFFPYGWFYKTIIYAIFAGIISIGVMLLGLFLSAGSMYIIALFMSVSLLIMTILLFIDSRRKQQIEQ
jgi:hypothetical protein